MSLTHSNSLLIWNNIVSHVSVESISFSFKMELICDGLFPTGMFYGKRYPSQRKLLLTPWFPLPKEVVDCKPLTAT